MSPNNERLGRAQSNESNAEESEGKPLSITARRQFFRGFGLVGLVALESREPDREK
jgi:hypothetical protein